MKYTPTPHGFQPIEITPDQYIFGSEQLQGVVLREDGQWYGWLPQIEIQRKYGLETMNCTVYGTLNCLEILHKFHFKEEVNKSERFTGIKAGTTQNGNNPHTVAESIRKDGVVDDIMLPFSESIDTWEKYYGPLPIASQLLKLAKEWLAGYTFGHDWVAFPGSSTAIEQKIDDMKLALRYSPLGASVHAWREKNGLYVKQKGDSDNHWVTVYGYEDGKCWHIFDHYDNVHKKLAWNYDFGFVKRYTLTKNTVVVTNWFDAILKRIRQFLRI